MTNVYRMLPVNDCPLCIEKDRRIHEMEQHDLDAADLKAVMFRRIYLGVIYTIIIGTIALCSCMMGLWALYDLPDPYAFFIAIAIWAAGVSIFLSIVGSVYSFHQDSEKNKLRLEEIRTTQHQKIRRLQQELRERKEAS